MFLSQCLLVYIKWMLDLPICANVVQTLSDLLYLSSLLLWFLWGHLFKTAFLEYYLKSWHSCWHSCGFFSFNWKLIIHTSLNPAGCVLASWLVRCDTTVYLHIDDTNGVTSLSITPRNFHCLVMFEGLSIAFTASHFKKESNRNHKGRNSPAYS